MSTRKRVYIWCYGWGIKRYCIEKMIPKSWRTFYFGINGMVNREQVYAYCSIKAFRAFFSHSYES